jgi:hypothetical protein
MKKAALSRFLLDRRAFLEHAARVSGAALATVPLIGCGATEETSPRQSADAGPADSGTTDSGNTATDASTPDGSVADTTPTNPWFRFAVIADTHIIDEWYTGPESNELDTTSMFLTRERMIAARDFLNSLTPRPEFICHVGDLIHDYPSDDLNFFFENRTRLDEAITILDGFGVPFHLCLGNHDYEFRTVPRAETHALFREKMGVEPWHAFEHRGWKFIFLDTYSGETHNPSSPLFLGDLNGSIGEEQLVWLQEQLADEKPCFIFLHQMLPTILSGEMGQTDIFTIIEEHAHHIKYVIAGHTHRWLDFGTEFGAPHMVMGATRYDEDCFIVCDVNVETGEFVFANQATWGFAGLFAERWQV